MEIVERIQHYAEIKNIKISQLERDCGFGKGTISKWKTSDPGIEKVKKVAHALDVTVQQLIGGGIDSQLTRRDERDIAKQLESTLKELESEQQGLMFSGEPLDDNTRELLKVSLENSIRIAKIDAKQKYTPKKYRKTE